MSPTTAGGASREGAEKGEETENCKCLRRSLLLPALAAPRSLRLLLDVAVGARAGLPRVAEDFGAGGGLSFLRLLAEQFEAALQRVGDHDQVGVQALVGVFLFLALAVVAHPDGVHSGVLAGVAAAVFDAQHVQRARERVGL